jgi:DNA-binding ferritin-like protein
VQCSHWQCKGNNFYEFHLLFDRIFKEIEDEIEEFGRYCAGKNIPIPYNYEDISRISHIQIPTDYTSEELMEALASIV